MALAALKAGEVQVLGTASRREALRHGLLLSSPYIEDRPVLVHVVTHKGKGYAPAEAAAPAAKENKA